MTDVGDSRQAGILNPINLEQFRRVLSDWVVENFDFLEAGGLGDYAALAASLRASPSLTGLCFPSA